MEVTLLKLFYHQLLNCRLNILNELLICIVLLQVQFIKNDFFCLNHIFNDWFIVICLILALEEVREEEQDIVVSHCFLIKGLIESLDVSKSNTLLLRLIFCEHLRA
jgi:hypothetical protein